MSDSVRPHRRQPTRLCRPWDSPGKNTGVGCHFLLQYMKVKSETEVAQSCPTLSDPMDCSPPGSSIHVIFQARVLEWGAIAFSIHPDYPCSNPEQGAKILLQATPHCCLSEIKFNKLSSPPLHKTTPLQNYQLPLSCQIQWTVICFHLPPSLSSILQHYDYLLPEKHSDLGFHDTRPGSMWFYFFH